MNFKVTYFYHSKIDKILTFIYELSHFFFFCTFEDQSLLLCIHIFFKARVNVLFYYTATLLYFLKINFSPESFDFVWLCNSLHGYKYATILFYSITFLWINYIFLYSYIFLAPAFSICKCKKGCLQKELFTYIYLSEAF